MSKKRRRGPGSVIRETLEAWRIKSHAGCGCTELAYEMDQVGANVVEEKITEYTQRMYDSIKIWRRDCRFPVPQPPFFVIQELIEYGIKTSRAELTI